MWIRIAWEPLPEGIHGITGADRDGYYILISSTDTPDRQDAALAHELQHIRSGDFARKSVEEIERCQRKRESTKEVRTVSVQP